MENAGQRARLQAKRVHAQAGVTFLRAPLARRFDDQLPSAWALALHLTMPSQATQAEQGIGRPDRDRI